MKAEPRPEAATASRAEAATASRARRRAIDAITASSFSIPTDAPESDGTLEWDQTTLVVVEVSAGGHTGLGYTYSDRATATLVRDVLAGALAGRDALAVEARWTDMMAAIRNLGRPGIASTAIAAVDVALWDVKAKILDLPLVSLLGEAREQVAVYGSGGFTSYAVSGLTEQLGGWVDAGIPRVKMKVGREPDNDPARVAAAREAIGDAALYVDANGAYSRKQALALADEFAASGVTWLEEPVVSSDLDGLRLIRDRGPAGMDITAGEYGYDLVYFRRMLEAGAVDVVQADASRCAGITGFLKVAALCEAFEVPLSCHCAPALHVHPACAASPVRHLEYFHDHARIERMLFDGAASPDKGALRPDRSRPGLGLTLKRPDAEHYAV